MNQTQTPQPTVSARSLREKAYQLRRQANRSLDLADALEQLRSAAGQVERATEILRRAAQTAPLSREELGAIIEQGVSLQSAQTGLKAVVTGRMIDLLVSNMAQRMGETAIFSTGSYS